MSNLNLQWNKDSLAQVLNVNTADNTTRKTNESVFERLKLLPGFAPLLLEIACDTSTKYSFEIPWNAAIQLKNYIWSNWKFTEDSSYNRSLVFDEDEPIIVISKDDKAYIRDNILDAVIYAVEIENLKILKQLNQTVKKILLFDFQKIWSEHYHQKIISCFRSNNQKRVYAGIIILHQLSKKFEFEDDDKQSIYNDVLVQINPDLLNFLSECKDINHPIQAQFIYKIIKIFLKSFQTSIPSIFVDAHVFGKWSEFILFYIQTPVTASNTSENTPNIFWKWKHVSYQIITKIHQKYADVPIAKAKNNFHETFLPFPPQYFQVLKRIYIATGNNETWIDSKCKNWIYNFFWDIVNKKKSAIDVISIFSQNDAMKEELIKDAIMTKSDVSLFYLDPKEYISKQLDETNSWFTKRYSANKMLNCILTFRGPENTTRKNPPDFFNEFYRYLINTIKLNAEHQERENQVIKEMKVNKANITYSSIKHNLIKESLMYMWQMNHELVVKHSPDTIEQVFQMFIIPELDSPLGWLREKACSYIVKFKDYHFTHPAIVNTITVKICGMLEKDEDLPVRINSAIVVGAFIPHPNTRAILQGNIKTWLSFYLKLLEETEIEEIVESLQDVIKEFKDETKDFIIQWCDYLIKYFNKVIARDTDEEMIESNFSWVNSIIMTFTDIIRYFINQEQIYQQLGKYVDTIWDYCFANEFDKINEALDILNNILKHSAKVPKHTWKYFIPIIFTVLGNEDENKNFQNNFEAQVYEGYGYESVSDISRLIAYYIAKDPETFWSGSDNQGRSYLENTMQLIRRVIMICESKNEYGEIRNAVNLLLVIFSSWQGKIDKILNDTLELIIKNTGKEHMIYKISLRLLLSGCFIYNAASCLKYWEETNQAEKIFKFWFDGLDKLYGRRNIKYNLMGLSSLIIIHPNNQSKWIVENMKQIIEKIIQWTVQSSELIELEQKAQEGMEDEFREDNEEEDEEINTNWFYQKVLGHKGGFAEDEVSFGDDDEEVEWTEIDKRSDIWFVRDTLNHITVEYMDRYKDIAGIIEGNSTKLRKVFDNEQERLKITAQRNVGNNDKW